MLSYKIDFPSFFKPGIPSYDNDFSINLITGYQGTGKSYYAIYKLEKEFESTRVIYTNIKTYKSDKHKIIYFTKIEEIYNNTTKHAIFLIDELSKKFVKNSPLDRGFYSWLQQSRKNQRHVFMIMQEYIQVPQWLRGVANTIYTTDKIKFIPLFKTTYGFPVLNNETLEWEIDIQGAIIYKRNKEIANKYDTFEVTPIL